jgi:hypothetical protein
MGVGRDSYRIIHAIAAALSYMTGKPLIGLSYARRHCSSSFLPSPALLHPSHHPHFPTASIPHLQLLIIQLPLQLLTLRHLAHRLIEIVLVNRIAVVLDSEQTPKKSQYQ